MNARRAVFFDRDGTLMEEVNYCSDPALVKVFPGVAAALDDLRAARFAIVVVTNQSGIGRGLFTDEQYQAVHAEFLRQIGAGRIDASYYCPDAPGAPSVCRKPEPGMLLEAARDLALDLKSCWMVGDKAADIECGHRVGARTVLVRTGYGAEQQCAADYCASDAGEAAEIILATAQKPPGNPM
ncbi:MAG TPA: HAD family hydrolase [Verrucomicrobiae bacterium]|nr:HAD family hydrolase [Verrucomicrobiae bacterium]